MTYSRWFANACAAVLILAGVLLIARAFAGEVHSHDAHHATTTVPTTPAFGAAGDIKEVSRTIAIEMKDTMRFTPDAVVVKRGETIRFVIHNHGRLMHEMVLGSAADLQAHAKTMQQMPGMHHEAPNIAHARAGETQTLVWRFDTPGELQFACLVAGHAQAGMVGKIYVR